MAKLLPWTRKRSIEKVVRDQPVNSSHHPVLDTLETLLSGAGILIPSILVPILIGWATLDDTGTSTLSSFEQFQIGAFVFIGISFAIIVQKLRVIGNRTREDDKLILIENEFDQSISNIRTSFRKILTRSEMSENLYAKYFVKVAENIEKKIHQAASDQTLGVEEFTYAMTDILVAIIEKRNRDVIRLVHFTDEGADILSSSWGRRYYDYLTRMSCGGDIKIKRLIIGANPNELAGDDQMLLDRLKTFHLVNRNHQFRELDVEEWHRILTELNIRDKGDMGIWGDLYAYRTQSFAPYDIQGTWTTERRAIDEMIVAFDHAWEYAQVPEPSDRTHAMTTHELFTGEEPPEHLSQVECDRVQFGD